MTGKITATNLGDMMKFGKAFDMKKAAELAKSGGAAAPAAAPAAAAKKGGLNRDYIGRFFPGGFAWVKGEDTKKYALATNDANPWYVEEGRDGGIVAPPLFSVRLTKEVMFKAVTDPGLGADLLRLVHGEQDMEFLRPLRPWDLCSIRASVDGIEEKSSGELLHLGTRIYTGGELAVKMRMSMFIRGEKKADGGEKKKEEPTSHGPIVFTDTVDVTKDQSLRYADASLDNNPIHIDDAVAKMAGFPGVILQGLCTMAFTSRAVVQKLLNGDPTRLRRLAVRFAKPVLMGDKITTEGWALDAHDGRKTYGFQAKRDDGTIVISNGIAEVAS
jgi:acyl dehydratase